MTGRERWYRLHHARRLMLRRNREMVSSLVAYGAAVDVVDENHPSHCYMMLAIDFAVNPPYVMDPMLPHC